MKRKKVVALLLAAAMTSASFLPSVGTFNNGIVAMADEVNNETVAKVTPADIGLEENVDVYFQDQNMKFMTQEQYDNETLPEFKEGKGIQVLVGQYVTRGAIVTGNAITSAEALAVSLGAAVSFGVIGDDAPAVDGIHVLDNARTTTGVAASGSDLNRVGIVNSAAAISGSIRAELPGTAEVGFVSGASTIGGFKVKVMAPVAGTTVTKASLTSESSILKANVQKMNWNGHELETDYVSAGATDITYEWYYNADVKSKASIENLSDKAWEPIAGEGDDSFTSSVKMVTPGAYAVRIYTENQTSGSALVETYAYTEDEANANANELVSITAGSISMSKNVLSVVGAGHMTKKNGKTVAKKDNLEYKWYVLSRSALDLTDAEKDALYKGDYTYAKDGFGFLTNKETAELTQGMSKLYFAVRISDKTNTELKEVWLTGGPYSYSRPNDTGKKSSSSSTNTGSTTGSTSGSTGSNSTTGNNNTTNTSTTTTDTTKPADNAPTSTTVENADGSKTTTTKETKADGTVVESVKTEYKDGSTLETITETRKDGTTVETTIETAANGDKATTTYTTNPNTKTRSKEVSIVRVDGTSETTTITESTADGSATIVNATKDAAGETSIEYTLPANGSGLTVGKIETTAKKVVIPAKIAIAGGNATLKGVTSLRANTLSIEGKTIKVTKVGAAALKGNKTATKLTIGKNIKTIGKQAFMNASKVKTVNFKGNVNTIGKNSFKNINKKATIKIKATAKQFKALKKKIKNKGAAPAKVTYKRVK